MTPDEGVPEMPSSHNAGVEQPPIRGLVEGSGRRSWPAKQGVAVRPALVFRPRRSRLLEPRGGPCESSEMVSVPGPWLRTGGSGWNRLEPNAGRGSLRPAHWVLTRVSALAEMGTRRPLRPALGPGSPDGRGDPGEHSCICRGCGAIPAPSLLLRAAGSLRGGGAV